MQASTQDFLSRLVAARSASSTDLAIDTSNADASAQVATMLADAGFGVSEHDIPSLPSKLNVTGLAGPDKPGCGLLLAGHTDTVPCDPQAWDSDPFTLVEKNGNLHGLGSCDMKGFFAVIAEALVNLDLGKLRQPLRVWATANEEVGMQGAQHLASTSKPAAMALVGEPTSLQPVYAHKGALAEQIVCQGKSGHASEPSRGSNAIDAMMKICEALREDFESTSAKNSMADFSPPQPTLSFGHIQAGDSFNRIPDHCVLWLDRRLMPGENPKEVRERLHGVAQKTAAQCEGISIEFSPIVVGCPAFYTDPVKPIVKAAQELSGNPARTVSYATEAPYYCEAGMETLVMGAGSITVAHQPNEHVAISEIDEMAKIVRGLIERFCMDE